MGCYERYYCFTKESSIKDSINFFNKKWVIQNGIRVNKYRRNPKIVLDMGGKVLNNEDIYLSNEVYIVIDEILAKQTSKEYGENEIIEKDMIKAISHDDFDFMVDDYIIYDNFKWVVKKISRKIFDDETSSKVQIFMYKSSLSDRFNAN